VVGGIAEEGNQRMMAEEDILPGPRVDDAEAAEQAVTIGHQSALEIGGAGLVRTYMDD
jgi:HD superfamily phosphodiesterase